MTQDQGRRIHPFVHTFLSHGKAGTDNQLPAFSDRISRTRIVTNVSKDTARTRDVSPSSGSSGTKTRRSVERRSPDKISSPSSPIASDSPSLLSQRKGSLTPAAMFLSSFSSPPVAASLPDSEGAVVGGYTLGPNIGYGGFSTIRRAYSKSGGTVAVKIVRRADLAKQGNPTLARKRLDNESEVWASLSHEHILPLFSVVNTTYADYFITLFCPAGSLFDILKRDGQPALPQEEVGMMFRQVVLGLRYLHKVAGMVHRDIKLENVLVDEMGICRIGDFGMTTRIGEFDQEELAEQHDQPKVNERHRGRTGMLHPISRLDISRQHRNSAPPSSLTPTPSPHVFQPGSLPYASPELLLPRTKCNRLAPHPAQDIWALGVLLYVLLTGKLPFTDSFEPRLQMKILLGDYVVPSGIGRGAEKVLAGCLERSVSDRWTIDMVDDLAWGIGWGDEGDDLPSPSPDTGDVAFTKHQVVAKPSPCKPSPCADEDRIVLTATSLISKQALASSPIRQPSPPSLLTGRSTSTSCASRCTSPPHQASSPSNSNSYPNLASPPSTSSPHPFDVIASASPTSSLQTGRGRRRSPNSSESRSPSISYALPMTPVDFVHTNGYDPSLPRSIERGRKPLEGTHRCGYSFGSEDSGLDVLNEKIGKQRPAFAGGGEEDQEGLEYACFPWISLPDHEVHSDRDSRERSRP